MPSRILFVKYKIALILKTFFRPTRRKAKKEKQTRYSNGSDTQTLTQFRRALGDELKKRIYVKKGGWSCCARTHSVMKDVPNNLFVDLVVPNATSIVPPNISLSNLAEYEVVLATVDSTDKIGEIFGPSKIKPCKYLGGGWRASLEGGRGAIAPLLF